MCMDTFVYHVHVWHVRKEKGKENIKHIYRESIYCVSLLFSFSSFHILQPEVGQYL